LPLPRLRLRFGGREGGISTILILLAVVGFTGGDLGSIGGGSTSATSLPGRSPPEGKLQQSHAEAQMSDFVSAVLADTEDSWRAIFQATSL
jgi:predicted metalloprotease